MADRIVQVPNIGPVLFPDTMTDEQIIKAIQNLSDKSTAAAPALPVVPQTVGEKIMSSPVGGALRGLRDVAEGTVQLAARGAEQLPGVGPFFRPARQQFEQGMTVGEQQYRQSRAGQFMPEELDVGRMTGNVAGTLLPSTAAVRALKLAQAPIKAGAVGGAVSGAMQPVQTGATPQTLSGIILDQRPTEMSAGDYFSQKAQQIGLGGVLGAGGGYASDKLLNLLLGRGPTVAPVAGATTAQAQTSATVTPTASVTGGQMTPGVVGADASAALTQAQKAILDRGKAMGFRTTPGQETGSRSLQQMEARLESNPFTSGTFNEIKATNQKVLNQSAAQAIGVDAAELSNPVLAQAQRQISAVYNKVASPNVQKLDQMYVMNGIDLIDSAAEGLTTQPLRTNIFVKQLQELAAKGEATGNQLTTLSSKIGKRAKNEMTTANGDRELGNALFQIKEIVDDQLAAGLSAADQAAFQTARANYRNLMTLRSNPGVVNPSSGNVSGLNLASALTRKDPRGFMEGTNTTPMYEAARFAQAFRPIVGDSGTATRMMEITPLNMLLSMPTNIAASAYTSTPAIAAARRLQSGIVPAGVVNPATEEMLRRALPLTAGAGMTAGLLGQ
jgi:hypothetical protein